MQEQLVREPIDTPPPPDPGKTLAVILKFLAFWLASLVILVGIALLSNIEWARRHIESALCESFHRTVVLGKLSWSVGLHGLAIDTDRFEMKEKDGKPFINSGPSEIGIALLPLFEKKLVVKHLEFEKPEVWASRLSSQKWNFSDLLTEGPEIHMLQIEKGKLHLLNLHPESGANANPEGAWSSYDLNDLRLSLTFPKNKRKWPLFFSCKLPQKNENGELYETSVRLSATGKGPYKDWRENQYNLDLQLQNFDPSRFRPLTAKLPELQGLFNLSLKGDGVFNKGFSATISGDISKFKMPAAENQTLEIAQAHADTSLLVAPDKLQWKNLDMALESWRLRSSGELSDWQKPDPSYEATVGGELSDLKGFYQQVVSRFLPEQYAIHAKETGKKLEKIYSAEKDGALVGKASIELDLKGSKDSQTVATNIKAEGIPLAQLVDDEMGNNLFSALKLDPGAPIRGELSISPGRRLELKELEIPLEDSKVQLSGFVDQETNSIQLDFKADNLSFDTFKKRFPSDNQFIKALSVSNGKNKAYSVAGALDIKGSYKSNGAAKPEIFVDGNLKGLRLTRQDMKTPSCTNIKGRVIYSRGKVELRQLSGITAASGGDGSGDFKVNGYFYPEGKQSCELDLLAHDVSVWHLRDWFSRLGVAPQEGFERLSGDLQEIKAHVSSSNNKTETSFTINPSDLLVNMSGRPSDSAQQFRLSSGVISYEDEVLTAGDVNLSSKGGKLTLSGKMQGKIDGLKFKSARLRTDGFELADLQAMLKGNFYNEAGKSNASLPSFLTPSNTSSLHGKVYGEMQFGTQGNGGGVSGVIGFSNAGGRFGKTQVAVEKLTGVAVVTRDQVVIQDTTAQIGKSTFSLDGVISNYSSSNFNWQGQLRGQFYPDEVDAIMANLGHGIALGSRNTEALNLRVTGSGESERASLKFGGRASPSYGISLKTAFGTFHQPEGRPLAFRGGLELDEKISELSVSNFHLSSGQELLLASGTFRWADEKAEKPASLSFAVNTPTPIKTATLLEIVSQNPKEAPLQTSGTSQLNLKVEGPVNDLVLSGTMALEKNSCPHLQVENLSGKIDLPGWHFSKTGSEDALSIARLQLKSVVMNGLPLHDAVATLSLEGSQKISIKDCQAMMSGGKLSINASYNTQKHSFHADLNGSKLVVDELVKDLIDHSGGVTGLADISFSLDGSGASGDLLRNLSGSGRFNVYQGSVASFGKLQEKLNEANLLQQGIFGFNVNNLLQAMMPVKSGQFNEVSGKVRIGDGVINFDELRFEGNNLRMRAAGKFDFLAKHMDLDVAGDIPRVSSSIIPGAIGEMSRKVTLQRMFSIVTFRKLKDLPALPLLGDIANDDPRAFAFSVETPTEPPKLITQSVEKSFKWLPNKPLASAHPVPGI